MKEFSLAETRNPRYKELLTLFDEYFPNYQIFYKNFILELIGYDKHWRPDMYEYLEELGISDYGIIKSLYYIKGSISKLRDPARNTENNHDQLFKNSYFHFGLLFDTIDNILKCIILINKKLNERKDILKKKSKEELIKAFSKWIDKSYDNEFEKLKLGMSRIYYYPQHNRDFLKEIISDTEFIETYKVFINDIKTYRNYFTHNPCIDIVGSTKYGILVVKREKIQEYRTLTDIRLAIRINPDNFSHPSNLLQEDLIKSLQILNRLYEFLIAKMYENKNHQDYNSLIHEYIRESVKN